MKIRTFVVGVISTNCHLVSCVKTGEAVIFDSDFNDEKELEPLLEVIKQDGLKVKYIINTHGHGDHTGGNRYLMEATGARLMLHKADADIAVNPIKIVRMLFDSNIVENCPQCGGIQLKIKYKEDEKEGIVICSGCNTVLLNFRASPPPDVPLRDGDEISFGNNNFKVIHTPGHSPGGICLYSEAGGVLFSGDTLMKDSFGRTDLPHSTPEDLPDSLKRLLILPDETIVYSGHNIPTTIGDERAKIEAIIRQQR